jgi:DHA2 family multidrug resistance protein-like MFS transporter
MSQNFGWRSIFWVAVAVSGLGLWLLRAPESRAESKGEYRFDLPGVLAFMFTIVALEVLVTQGNKLGWTSPIGLVLLAAAVGSGWLFFRIEHKAPHAFFDLSLFQNSTYTGATISNFLVNGTAGTLIVSLQLVQLGGGLNAEQAGFLTLGYAIAIIAFIRVGEKLLQRYGPRKPMLWGCLITGLGILMVSPAHLPLPDYKTLASIGYTLFGVGLAFYATPSIDAALSNLPAAQVGSGAGIYKMASSLGAAFGVAISAAIFSARSGQSASEIWLDGMLTFAGREDNRAVREAAIVALGARAARSLLGTAVAVLSMRGQWMTRADGLPVMITVHPSSLLRVREASEREAAFEALVRDLREARQGHRPN